MTVITHILSVCPKGWLDCPCLYGFLGMMKMLQANGNAMLPGMANWTTMPEDWSAFDEGVKEEMASLPDWMGHTDAQCTAYRDRALIEALKLHRKL